MPLSQMGKNYEPAAEPKYIPPTWPLDRGPDYIVGLDLGQAQDFSALCLVDRVELPDPNDPDRKVRDYSVRRLHRWRLGTPYTADDGAGVVDDLARFAAQPGLSGKPLVVDATGCGRPVLDIIRRAKIDMALKPVTVHGGHDTSIKAGIWSVPKKDLVAVMQTLIQANRFHISPELPEAAVLGAELKMFRAKINLATGNETLESWRERDHDDLVFAVALACWFGQRGQRRVAVC